MIAQLARDWLLLPMFWPWLALALLGLWAEVLRWGI